jgi:hypothetical protein
MKYTPAYIEVDAFKIMPDSRDINKWPEWLKSLNNSEGVVVLNQYDTVCLKRPGCGLEIIQNGNWVVKQGDMVSIVPDYKFILLFKEIK